MSGSPVAGGGTAGMSHDWGGWMTELILKIGVCYTFIYEVVVELNLIYSIS